MRWPQPSGKTVSVNTATGEIDERLMTTAGRRPPSAGELVVVTGMTGAGRSTAAKELEDLGYFVVDNLPPELLRDVVRLVDESQGPEQPIARRGRRPLRRRSSTSLQANLAPGRDRPAHRRCSSSRPTDDVLVRRQEAARRPHPLQGGGRLLDGLSREREVLADLRGDADLVIDTSDLNVHQLTDTDRRGVRRPRRRPRLQVTVVSFGFKYGIPVDADFVADMRFLPNPHWVPELRPQTGRDADVADYVLGQPGAAEFLDALRAGARGRRRRATSREGKRFVTVAIGCTGGKHRSVAMTEEIGRRLQRRAASRPGPPTATWGGSSARSGPGDVPAVVALGGGHGLAASLSALRLLVDDS